MELVLDLLTGRCLATQACLEPTEVFKGFSHSLGKRCEGFEMSDRYAISASIW
jgi:hypothetical protein